MIYLIFAQYMKYIMEQHSEYGLKTNSKVHEIIHPPTRYVHHCWKV